MLTSLASQWPAVVVKGECSPPTNPLLRQSSVASNSRVSGLRAQRYGDRTEVKAASRDLEGWENSRKTRLRQDIMTFLPLSVHHRAHKREGRILPSVRYPEIWEQGKSPCHMCTTPRL